MIQWPENLMLPCTYRELFDICCPCCGFQRSVASLLRGDIVDCLLLYPALFPIGMTGLYAIYTAISRNQRHRKILTALIIADASLMIIGALLKNFNILPK